MGDRVSIRPKGRALSKIKKWAEYGFSGSDVIRIALALLPEDPREMVDTKELGLVINGENQEQGAHKTHGAKAVLKKLQDW